MKVKGIMNEVYQSLAVKLKAKESFQSKEVLATALSVIKVSKVPGRWSGDACALPAGGDTEEPFS